MMLPPAPLAQIWHSSSLEISVFMTLGATVGATLTLFVHYLTTKMRTCDDDDDDADEVLAVEAERRERLPSLVILVRHGESEGNVDRSMWWTKPDNLIRLTPKGIQQATEVGQRVESIFQAYENRQNGDDDGAGNNSMRLKRVHLHVSPFQRTLETARYARRAFFHRLVRQDQCPRLREQEFGNFQSNVDSLTYREEQRRVGRFWYRFPTGESGADVYDRVSSYWYDTLLKVNDRVGYDPVDAVVVVCHGLSIRFLLMQLYSWSPTTFHSVYNAGNCDAYVLRKDLSKPGLSPYVLDPVHGDVPQSSIDIHVRLKLPQQTGGGSITVERVFKLHDYLSIPPPRMTRIDIVKKKLVEQYPDEIGSVDSIETLTFMPFYSYDDNTLTIHSSNVDNRNDNISPTTNKNGHGENASRVQGRTSLMVENLEDDPTHLRPLRRPVRRAVPESSHRWPCSS